MTEQLSKVDSVNQRGLWVTGHLSKVDSVNQRELWVTLHLNRDELIQDLCGAWRLECVLEPVRSEISKHEVQNISLDIPHTEIHTETAFVKLTVSRSPVCLLSADEMMIV